MNLSPAWKKWGHEWVKTIILLLLLKLNLNTLHILFEQKYFSELFELQIILDPIFDTFICF